MRYVALGRDGQWLAVVGFGAAALACKPRDTFIGWSDDQHFRRLKYVTNNQRFCVLPDGRIPNLATNVLAKTLARLCGDFESRWRHPVVMVETFVDPSRHVGTCYRAGGFTLLGETLGYGRTGGRYHHHGQRKLSFARLLRRDARSLLRAPFDHPVLTGERRLVIDLSALDLVGESGLMGALEGIVDHRMRRGVRHKLPAILALATAATLAGARSVSSIGEYAADCLQGVLARLGAKYHPTKKRYIAPHAETFRRALSAVDVEALDRAVGGWLFAQVRAGHISGDTVALALDGKSLRGALREDGRCVHLFSAMVHGSGIVVGQNEVDEKSNEITAFRLLLASLGDLSGALVTADAMHTQRDHAHCVVEEHHGDYLFQVKDNQPTLLAALMAIPEGHFSAEHTETSRGHGRTEHRYVRVADIPDSVDFPFARQVVLVYRERANLADVMRSAETSYYVTSVTKGRGDPSQLGAHVRGHWGIENKVHYVRDWTFDEDRRQTRAQGSGPRALATLRNLAISLLRLAGAANIAASTRWVSRDATRAAVLLGV